MTSSDPRAPHPHDVPGDMSLTRHVLDPDTTAARPAMLALGPVGSLALVAFDGACAGAVTVHALDRPLVFGRGEGCDVVLADGSASRSHARISPSGDGASAQVADLGSRNGTFVDGRRVAQAAASPGGLVRVGDTMLRVCLLTERASGEGDGPFIGGLSATPVRRLISLVGPTDLPVLVLGETGTGKEVVARMLHVASGRRGPFIAVNCAALPEALVESELFGHVRGAFTDAGQGRKGLFQAASGGTLFLDEVGDIPSPAQAKLLRVLEDGLVRAVGSEQSSKVDVRVLSATNRDLAQAVAEKRFRADLLARLAAVEVRTPPLRARPEDLPLLGGFLLSRAGRRAIPISGDALEAMALYEWPQNVRELDNVLRAATLNETAELVFELLPDRLKQRLHGARGSLDAGGARPRVDDPRQQLEEALRIHRGNVRRASQAVGMARSHVYRLLERWNLDPERFRPGGTDVAEGGTDR